MNQHDKVSLLRDTTASAPPEPRNYDSVDHQAPSIQEEQVLTPAKSRKLPQYVAALTATLCALSAGAVLGWTSPILSEIEHGNFHNITVNNNQMGWIGSFVTVGAMFMCIPTGFLCDLIGRKTTLLLLFLPFTLGWALILTANSVTMLYIGRLITGMAAGASCVAVPLYTSEIAQKEIRGTLGSYFQLMVTIGIFLAYLIGKFLNSTHHTIFCSLLPVLFVILFVFQPESPVYCIRKGLHDSALKSLVRLRGSAWDNEGELADIENTLKESLEASISIKETLTRKTTLRGFLVAFALMFFQQFSGINAIILYTSDIFTSANVQLDSNTAAILVGGFQAGATFLSSLVIDKLGRRVLLLLSSTVMALSTLLLGIYFSLKNHSDLSGDVLKELNFIPTVSLCIFVVVFSLGLGPIPWIISSEIFTPEIKSVASSAVGTFNWFLAFIVTKFYLQVNDFVGQDTTFYVFAGTSLVGAVFIFGMVPETKGRTIEQILVELDD